MSYEINDQTLIAELRKKIPSAVHIKYEELKTELKERKVELPENFTHPLDKEIIGEDGKLAKLLSEHETAISYSKADELALLWRTLLDKSIVCLRYLDTREPFQENPNKVIVAYGIDKLEEYHRRYTEFESLMYGSNAHYRDHVFHAIRVWMLGVYCMLTDFNNDQKIFINTLILDGGATTPDKIGFFEYISMWTIIALCHDLGYPLEKAEQILEKTRNMMREFLPSPNIWNNFGYSGTQDNINEYILKFISTKMKGKPEGDVPGKTDEESRGKTDEESSGKTAKPGEEEYLGRIQPKYYLKYAKSLESFQHGIISTIIVYKMLLYFLESDFNLNDDYIYKKEDARQFYIRREILRAIAAHTCPDAYNIHLATFSSLLFLCDEFQEWGRRRWNELYTGLEENAISLEIEKFSPGEVKIKETINMEGVKDKEIIVQNISRVFERQYALYKITFRDGQYTAKRDFALTKTMEFVLPKDGAEKRNIILTYKLPEKEVSCFIVNLSNSGKEEEKERYKEKIKEKLSKQMYYSELRFT